MEEVQPDRHRSQARMVGHLALHIGSGKLTVLP
jgi:hypothetical protein